MKVIRPESWRAQPWRNGAGTTYELVREPAEPAPFGVRISVAAIERPAPFSAFPGYSRALYLVDGGPVTLSVPDGAQRHPSYNDPGGVARTTRPRIVPDGAGDTITLARPGDEVLFAGDADVAATSVAVSSRDLNFMVRDGIPWRSSAVRTSVHLAAHRVAVFVLASPVQVAGTDLPALACAWCEGSADVTVGDGGLAIALCLGSA